MSYEFKKLSDVDVVAEPTESANVLIEENGVIKKAPKTAVGGGSEVFIKFNVDLNEGTVSCDSSFNEIVEAFSNGFPMIYMLNKKTHGYFLQSCVDVAFCGTDGNSTHVFENVDYISLYTDSGSEIVYHNDGEIEFISGEPS